MLILTHFTLIIIMKYIFIRICPYKLFVPKYDTTRHYVAVILQQNSLDICNLPILEINMQTFSAYGRHSA